MLNMIKISEEMVGNNYPSISLIIVIGVILAIIIAIDIKRGKQ